MSKLGLSVDPDRRPTRKKDKLVFISKSKSSFRFSMRAMESDERNGPEIAEQKNGADSVIDFGGTANQEKTLNFGRNSTKGTLLVRELCVSCHE